MNEKERATLIKENLKSFLKDEVVIYSIVLSVSSSGTSRKIKFLAIDNGRIRDITYNIGVLKCGGAKHSRDDSTVVTVAGSGMDMAYHIVESLSRELGIKLIKQSL